MLTVVSSKNLRNLFCREGRPHQNLVFFTNRAARIAAAAKQRVLEIRK